MPLSWNEIKHRALQFSLDWQEESRERAEKDTFWNEFFNVFGIQRRRVAVYEQSVKKLGNKRGFIDVFWKGTLLIEHKSKGEDLDAAFEQATDYFSGIAEEELPPYILVSDFERFRLYNLDQDTRHDFTIKTFHTHITLFGFMVGYNQHEYREEDPVNIQAAELMGKLHDKLKLSGYGGHALELYLVRLLFCLFADDTAIFDKDSFKEFIDIKTNQDGSDLGAWLNHFFQTLNTPEKDRNKNLDEHLMAFPYINGKLFEETLPIPSFNSSLRSMLLKAGALDWGKISPAIFGSMFQSIMNPQERRNLGAHYTTEKNIIKVIRPLFLENLTQEFHGIKQLKGKRRNSRLQEFHQKLSELTFLDPACGCGNFLILAYRELRLLEIEVLKLLHGKQQVIDIKAMTRINVHQFYGIEIVEFPAQVAQVALWLMDHQMNLKTSEAFGMYYARIPLSVAPTIVNANALTMPWEDVVPPHKLSYILGNPPFVGARLMSKQQKSDLNSVFGKTKKIGELDYVSAWYKVASDYVQGTTIRCGFVSSNSITQGEQVPILWKHLIEEKGISINFAHQTFKWSSEAKRKAAVYCVIVGFALQEQEHKRLFTYESVTAEEPMEQEVQHINPYLIEAEDVFVESRTTPLCSVPKMGIGNKPIDNGNYLFSKEEMEDFIQKEPLSKQYFRLWYGSEEFIHNKPRWCLWAGDIPPQELKRMPYVLKRIENVKVFRSQSKSLGTRKIAETPTRFHVENMPQSDYLIIPRTSSEIRSYIPMGFLNKKALTSDGAHIVPNATLYHFGVLMSAMHMAWMRTVAGRLELRYRYSKSIVYNNFPWPFSCSTQQEPKQNESKETKAKENIEQAAQKVLAVREEFKEATLADLYDPLTMPASLRQAHAQLDKAVDKAYGKSFVSENERIDFLLRLYKQLTSP